VSKEHQTRLALPGKGTLESATMTFLSECGMKVNRSNPRQYLARIHNIPDVEVVFSELLIYHRWYRMAMLHSVLPAMIF